MSLNKDQLRTVKARAEENIIPYVSTHNPRDPEMFRVIADNIPILRQDDKMTDIFIKIQTD